MMLMKHPTGRGCISLLFSISRSICRQVLDCAGPLALGTAGDPVAKAVEGHRSPSRGRDHGETLPVHGLMTRL